MSSLCSIGCSANMGCAGVYIFAFFSLDSGVCVRQNINVVIPYFAPSLYMSAIHVGRGLGGDESSIHNLFSGRVLWSVEDCFSHVYPHLSCNDA